MMLPGLTELLMAAQVTLVSPTALPPTVGQPITQQALQPLSVVKVNCKYVDLCCKPADGCTCNGSCK
ncbi:MAG: hypothetical protein ACLQLG_11715 [Thermoguttaceae bacterium]